MYIFGKLVSATMNFTLLKTFLMRLAVILKSGLMMLNDEMYQHLEDLHNSVNLYFPSDQLMLQNHCR